MVNKMAFSQECSEMMMLQQRFAVIVSVKIKQERELWSLVHVRQIAFCAPGRQNWYFVSLCVPTDVVLCYCYCCAVIVIVIVPPRVATFII